MSFFSEQMFTKYLLKYCFFSILGGMNRLPLNKRVLILRCLLEGMGIRSTARTADVEKKTVSRLLAAAGYTSAAYQDRTLRNLSCKRIQVDEIWAFVYAKEGNLPKARAAPSSAGDVYTWIAMCPDTRLVPTWRVGDRSAETAMAFIQDLKDRLAQRVQLTSDGYKPYVEAVEAAFGGQIDYAMLAKIYKQEEIELQQQRKFGKPDPDYTSTSMIERQNLTLRMSCRRFTRRTNAFSKKVEFHACAVALHFLYYNFCRIHQTLRVSPAMEAGVTDTLYDLDWIAALIEADQPKPKRPSAYKPRRDPSDLTENPA